MVKSPADYLNGYFRYLRNGEHHLNRTRRRLLIEGGRWAATLAALKGGVLNAPALELPAGPGPDGQAGGHDMGQMGRPVAATGARPVHRPLRVDTLEKFVDPLPVPPVAKSLGLRPHPQGRARGTGRSGAARVLQVHDAAGGDAHPSRRAACADVELRRNRAGADDRSAERPRIACRVGECAPGEASVSDRPHAARRRDRCAVRCARRFMCMGARCRPSMTGFLRTGRLPGKVCRRFIRSSRRGRRSGITTTRWALNGSTSMQASSVSSWCATKSRRKLGLPRGKYEIPLAFRGPAFSADGGLYYPDSGDPNASVGSRSLWRRHVSQRQADALSFLKWSRGLYRFQRLLNAANSRTFLCFRYRISRATTRSAPIRDLLPRSC